MRKKLLLTALALADLCFAQETKSGKDAGPTLPEGEGKEVVVRMCNKCHGPAVFAKTRMGRVGWEDQVAAMIEKGAVGTDEEIQTVVNYMVKYFGRDTNAKAAAAVPEKVNVNKATAKQLETGLGLTAKQAEAIVQYREKNGNFHEWGDLMKVSDLDGKALEAKRGAVEF